jgi:tetratricopeptide (TPR) repeat protein
VISLSAFFLCIVGALSAEADDAVSRGHAALKTGNFAEAVTCFTLALAESPNDFSVRSARAYAHAHLGQHNDAIADYNAVIASGTMDSRALAQRAKCFIALNRPTEAMNDVLAYRDRFFKETPFQYLLAATYLKQDPPWDHSKVLAQTIQDWPSDDQLQYCIAMLFFKNRDYDSGKIALRKMLSLDKAHLGALEIEELKAAKLDEAAIIEAKAELQRVLADRPEMAINGIEGSPIFHWIFRRMAGMGSGCPVRWDASPPTKGFDAGFRFVPGKKGRLLVRLKQSTTAPQTDTDRLKQWCDLVFECENVQNAEKAHEITLAARLRFITADDFADKINELEYKAAQRTRALFVLEFGEWLEARKLEPPVEQWYGNLRPTFDEWADSIPARKMCEHYKGVYDKL